MQTIESNQFDRYGSGAESKLRLEDSNNPSYKKANAPYYAPPISEGRMRSQEQSRFISQDMKSQDVERRYTKPIPDKRPVTNVMNIASKATRISSSSIKPAAAVAANPFDEDDDIEYNESKNPFADDAGESSKSDVAKETSNNDKQIPNPFGEYDSNLNPFD